MAGGRCLVWVGRISPQNEIRSQSQKPVCFFIFSFLNLRGQGCRVRPGRGMVALEMNFSASVVAAPMPGDSCLAQQDSPQWTPQQPVDFTQNQTTSIWKASIIQFGIKIKEMREKHSSVLIQKAKEILCNFSTYSSKGELSKRFNGIFSQTAFTSGILMGFFSRMWICLD